MQSGKARTDQWILDFVPAEAKKPDPLMGWAGSGDMRQPLARDGVGERAHHRFLADQLGKGPRAILAGEHAVGLRGRCWSGFGVVLERRRSRLGRCAEHRRLTRRFELRRARLSLRALVFRRLPAEHVA